MPSIVTRAVSLGLFLTTFGGCFSVPEGQIPVHGADTAVIVHNYAMAFRDFLRAESADAMLPLQPGADIPFTGAEWFADNVTTNTPVTHTTNGVYSESTVTCGPEYCTRKIFRKFSDGFRLDETAEVYYRRGATDIADDDRILGFTSLVRYPDQVLSQSAATEPANGDPWVVTTQYGFSGGDNRQTVEQLTAYPEFVSGAVPQWSRLVYRTKEAHSQALYEVTPEGWRYMQGVTFETSQLVEGTLELQRSGDAFSLSQNLRYGSGVEIWPIKLQGNGNRWDFSGETFARGGVKGLRTESDWEREQTFPKGLRFKHLTDYGTRPSSENRGAFNRTIVGQKETLSILGTYRLKAPGVWELNAAAEGGIRIELTYQTIPLADVWQGTWVQSNARSSNSDSAKFTITAHPDWTSQMTYTYDRADTPFSPDESGSLRMMPDTRGSAVVSVVSEKSSSEQRHKDYTLRIVAEGQQP